MSDTEQRYVTLPIAPGEYAYLTAPFPLDERDWSLLMSVLESMKPGLVEHRQAARAEAGGE